MAKNKDIPVWELISEEDGITVTPMDAEIALWTEPGTLLNRKGLVVTFYDLLKPGETQKGIIKFRIPVYWTYTLDLDEQDYNVYEAEVLYDYNDYLISQGKAEDPHKGEMKGHVFIKQDPEGNTLCAGELIIHEGEIILLIYETLVGTAYTSFSVEGETLTNSLAVKVLTKTN